MKEYHIGASNNAVVRTTPGIAEEEGVMVTAVVLVGEIEDVGVMVG